MEAIFVVGLIVIGCVIAALATDPSRSKSGDNIAKRADEARERTRVHAHTLTNLPRFAG